MAQFVEAIPHLLLRVFAPALGITLVAWLVVLFIQLFSGKRHSCRAASPRGGLGKPVWVGLAALAVVCTTLCGKNTNGVQNVGGGHLFQFNPPLVQVVSPQDVSNGWRVAEETEAESFAQPSANAITNELWRRRGAFDDALRIPANGWSYPYATGVTVLARGELRTVIRAHDFPRAFTQGISLLPLVNWSQLPEGRRESIFWYDTTSSNTLLTTWWNAALGRDATNPVNFQAELYPDGSFTYRYEDRTVRHARVWPFDWDNDGLENTVDPDPLTPGPDAHGTNAEWYNTVCSNVFSAVATSCDPPGSGAGGTQLVASVELSWRESVNSNAYYFVDVVTEHGPTPIYFTSDRESRLGNPVLVALAGVTNRVPLLIGIDYAITSPVPFAVSFPIDYMYPEVAMNGVADYNVRWPLNFVFTEGIGASNRVYTVTVEPYDPGGVLEWDVNAPVRGGSGGDCDCVYCSGYSALFSCSSTCTCSGGCRARGRYLFEVAEFPLTGGECRCGFDDPPPDNHEPSSHAPDDPPSLTITFSEQAVIFEDAYEESPGVMMPRRSTRVRLTIDAYAGAQGGALWISDVNMNKLVVVDGDISLPYSQQLAAGESYHATGVFEGLLASDSAQDVTVSGVLTETGTSGQVSSSEKVTAVRVELTPCATAPENPSAHRHLLGIGEIVNCLQYPSSPSVTWQSDSGWTVSNSLGVTFFTAPLLAGENGIHATCEGQVYSPRVRVIEPEGIVAENAEAVRYGVPKGEAGGIGMKLDLYVIPRMVSFSNIAMQETPCLTGTHSGYFDNPAFADEWCHRTNHGAGEWHDIRGDNFFFKDYPRVQGAWPRMMNDGTITTDKAYGWQDGTMVWDIPIGWGAKGTEDNSGQVGVIEGYKQEFVIFSDGFAGVRKFSNQVTRRTNDVVHLNGVLKP